MHFAKRPNESCQPHRKLVVTHVKHWININIQIRTAKSSRLHIHTQTTFPFGSMENNQREFQHPRPRTIVQMQICLKLSKCCSCCTHSMYLHDKKTFTELPFFLAPFAERKRCEKSVFLFKTTFHFCTNWKWYTACQMIVFGCDLLTSRLLHLSMMRHFNLNDLYRMQHVVLFINAGGGASS